MLRKTTLAAALAASSVLAGCATIVHSGPRSISIASTPPGARVSIYDRSNALVQQNTTPFIAQLPTRYGYFKGQTYRLVFELPAHQTTEVTLKSTVSGWYAGNLIFGGLIGMLVIDPLSGAMYNLTPEKIEQPLTPAQSQVLRDGSGVLVVLASQVTAHERSEMTRIDSP